MSAAPEMAAWIPALEPPPWTLTKQPGLDRRKASAQRSANGWTLVDPATMISVSVFAREQAGKQAASRDESKGRQDSPTVRGHGRSDIPFCLYQTGFIQVKRGRTARRGRPRDPRPRRGP